MTNPKRTDLRIRCIGTVAMDTLSAVRTAAIIGVTSRGIFLQAAEERVIFLSFEGYRGPLTANLSGDLQPLRSLSPGGTVAISQGRITFADSGAISSTRDPELWKPPHPVGPPLNSPDRRNLIRDLASEVYGHKGTVGLGKMLPTLADFGPKCATGDNRWQDTRAQIDDIRSRIAQSDLLPLAQSVQSFLGLGSGLTPSGDDFVMGLLLTLNRWESVLRPGDALSIFNEEVVQAAYRHTTTLSANLIESAVLGLADERLIRAVDFLAAAEYRQSEVLPGLLNWGNSSGVDGLVGMITAFSPI